MEIGDYRISIAGHEEGFRIVSLNGRPDRPAAGDLLISGMAPPLVLGEPGRVELRSAGEGTNRVLSEDPAASSASASSATTIACRVGEIWLRDADPPEQDPEAEGASAAEGESRKVLVNPLIGMSTAEIRALRGIAIASWDPALEPILAQVDGEQCALSIDAGVFEACNGGLPPLPLDLRYLVVEFSSWGSEDRFDLSSLSRYPELRVVVVQFGASIDLDIGVLSGASGLRVLRVPRARLHGLDRLQELVDLRDLALAQCDALTDRSAAGIGALGCLRRLDLSGCGNVTSLDFARTLRDLELIDVSRTGIVDLAPLGDLPALEEILAVATPVTSLPQGSLPSLKRLDVMSTALDAGSVADFRRRHAGATVLHDWAGALREAVTPFDRVRVRTGGTCHRRPNEERTIAEERDREAIDSLLRALEIDEGESGGHCMCCGDPTIEFVRGDDVVGEVALHHGRSARWRGWPGDAMLTLPSRDRLSTWLAERGEQSFAAAHAETKAGQESENRLIEESLEVLPAHAARSWISGALRATVSFPDRLSESGAGGVFMGVRGPNMMGRPVGTDRKGMAAAIADEVQDPVEIAAVAFRLLGCGEGSWNEQPHKGLHAVAVDLLRAADPAVRSAALARVADETRGFEGVVRWLLYHGGIASVPRDVFGPRATAIVRHALSHPRPFNRRHTLALLGRSEGDVVVGMLREVLHGLPVRRIDPRHATEPGGWVVTERGPADVPDDASDAACAALALARLGDVHSHASIRALSRRAAGPSRTVLLEAVATLEKIVPTPSGMSFLGRARSWLGARPKRRKDLDPPH